MSKIATWLLKLLPRKTNGKICWTVIYLIAVLIAMSVIAGSAIQGATTKIDIGTELNAVSDLEDKIAFSIATNTDLTLAEAIARVGVRDSSVSKIPTFNRYVSELKPVVKQASEVCKDSTEKLERNAIVFNYQSLVEECKQIQTYNVYIEGLADNVE